MPVLKNCKPIHFDFAHPVEKHFHDHDETWVIMGGKGKAYMVDREGKSEEFMLEKGDIWMVEAGVEHGLDCVDEGGCDILPFGGTIPEGSHTPGHYYMEKENYMPTLVVRKDPIDRYAKGAKK